MYKQSTESSDAKITVTITRCRHHGA